MRRTGPPQRRTPLTPGSKLESTSLPRRTRIRPQSAKRRREQKTRRQLASPYEIERCAIDSPVCTGWAEAWHELVGRAQGGSITDPRNLVGCANACNGWVEDNPLEARSRGWKVPSHDAKAGKGGLVPKVLSPLSLAYRMEEGL